MADMQQTLSLLLSARDDATPVLKAMGDQMAVLGRQAEELRAHASNLGFDIGSSQALKAATDAHIAQVKASVDKSIQEVQREGREATQAYRDAADAAARASREQRDKEIENARTTKDEKLALATKAAREENAQAAQVARERIAAANAAYKTDTKNFGAAEAQKIALAKSASVEAIKFAQETAERLNAMRAVMGGPAYDIGPVLEGIKHTEEAAIAAAKNETVVSTAESAKRRDAAIKDANAEKAQVIADSTAKKDAIIADANKIMAKARADHEERLRLSKEERERNLSEIQEYTTSETTRMRREEPGMVQAVQAGAEQALSAEALRGTADALTTVQEKFGTLQEALRIPPPEGLKIVTADLHKVSEAAAVAIPPVRQLEMDLKKAVTAAGETPANQFSAIGAEVRKVTQVIESGAREQLESVTKAAVSERQVIQVELARQKDDIRAYVTQQVTLIETFSRQIQTLLSTAYSAPGISDSLRAEGQKVIEDARLQLSALTDIYKTQGQQMTREAEKAAQEARTAVDMQLKAETRAVESATEKEVMLRREAGEKMATSLRAATAESKKFAASLKEVEKSSETALGPLGHIVNMGRQMLVWGIGYQLVMSVYSAAQQAAGGLIVTNVQVEQLGMTFSAIYQTSQAAGTSMIHWLDTFAQKVPGTRQEVREAALAFAAAGDNVEKILPAASNLAAIMGVDLPTAAHAMVDAQMGRFEMLQMTLKTTKAQLEAYGLEVDRTGHVTANSFVPAIERYTAVRFGEHVAFDTAQLKAFHQQLQSTGAGAGTVEQDIRAAAMIRAGDMPGDTSAQQTERQKVLARTLEDIHGAQRRNISDLQDLTAMYGVTEADLDKIDKGWRATGASAEAAFAKWYAATHGGEQILKGVHQQDSAIELQMKTLGGAWSNIHDVLTNLQQIMGQGMFDVMRVQVTGLYKVLQSPAVAIFVHEIGSMLGDALQNGIKYIKEWYKSVGGLPGVLRLVETTAKDVWGAIQGVGDAFGELGGILHNLFTLIQPVLSGLHIIGQGSRDGAGAVRVLVQTLVDLFIAMKAVEAVSALSKMWEVLTGKWVEATKAARAVKEEQLALAKAQALAAETAAAETTAEQVQTAALARNATASEAAAAGTILPSGIALPKGAMTAGAGAVATGAVVGAEAAAGGAEAAVSVGVFDVAMTAVSGFTATIAAAAPPILALTAIIGGLVVIAGQWKRIEQERSDAQVTDLAQSAQPPRTYKQTMASSAWTTMVNTQAPFALAALLGIRPSLGAHEVATDPYKQFVQQIPPDALKAMRQSTQGTKGALIEHARAWYEYLAEHPKVLKELDAALKAAGKPTLSLQQVQQTSQTLTQMSRGFTKDDVTDAKNQVAAVNDRINADVNSLQSDVVGRVLMLRDAVEQVGLKSGLKEDKALKDAVAAENAALEKIWGRLLEKTKEEIAGSGVLTDTGWIKSHWKTFSPTVQQGFTQQGLAPGQPPGAGGQYTQDAFAQNLQEAQKSFQSTLDQDAPWKSIREAYGYIRAVAQRGKNQITGDADALWDTLHKAMQAISQHFQQKVQWDESLGMPFTVIKQGIASWVQHLRAIGMKPGDIAQAVVPTEIKDFQATLPSMVLEPYRTVQKDFSDFAERLKSEGLKPDEIAAVLSQTWQDYYKNKIDNIKSQLQMEAESGIVPVSTELGQVDDAIRKMLAANAAAIKAHKPPPFSDADLAVARKQMIDMVWSPQVQAANTQLQYDEAIKAPQAKILEDYQVWAAALDQTSASATEKALQEQQARQKMAQDAASSADLQLQYDQEMKRPWPVIVQDIRDVAATLSAAGVDARTVAIKTHQLMMAAAQQEEQTQQTYIQYAETMGEGWGVIMQHINQRAAAMTAAETPNWQVIMAKGQDIEGAADMLLQNALDTGSSFKTAHDIIMEGAKALRDAGWSRIAVEKWVTSETKKAFEPFLQQAETARTTAFDLAVQQGRLRGPQDVMQYVHGQMALYRQAPRQPGETQPEYNLALQKQQNDLLKTGFDALLKTATDQFTYDSNVAAPRMQTLQADTKKEIQILGFELKKGLISPLEYKLLVQQANATLANVFGGASVGQPPPPQYGRVSPFMTPTGYGTSTAFFGAGTATRDPNAAVIARLDAQLAYWRERATRDEQLLDQAKATARNTQRTADATRTLVDRFGQPLPVPGGGLSTGARLRGAGSFIPKPHS